MRVLLSMYESRGGVEPMVGPAVQMEAVGVLLGLIGARR
jgi:hypothetical protein